MLYRFFFYEDDILHLLVLYVENGMANRVTYIMCDLDRIRKHTLPSFCKLYHRICTVRHIRIKIIHRNDSETCLN